MACGPAGENQVGPWPSCPFLLTGIWEMFAETCALAYKCLFETYRPQARLILLDISALVSLGGLGSLAIFFSG